MSDDAPGRLPAAPDEAATGVDRPDGDRLRGEVDRFADELRATLRSTVPGEPGTFRVVPASGPTPYLAVQQTPVEGIGLAVDAVVVLRLRATFECGWDHTGTFLAVRRSTMSATAEGTDEPLFRYDYDAGSDEKVPAAHLNVHGHRDELVFAMMAAGHRLRGRARTSAVRRGRVPRVSTLHFPLGGHRFRPSFEDVLDMLVREFGLDTRPGWRAAICAGRARWRAVQLRAAVRDDPGAAVEALAGLGYEVRLPPVAAVARADAAPGQSQ
ncbi:hypothetical protein [Cellulomonas pakistanensis]|uniref:Uncharacterized protein n=1 Tax=Cellulomonas pakistanensis TaxID=992287 RepID=A0A919U735_9CELL|nr:hypothetical protein [Cellulomonas pakistanensis]GIG37644.1 hypothetical protein Cpa01nite_30250 [Cellulomonas pakistanensis]